MNLNIRRANIPVSGGGIITVPDTGNKVGLIINQNDVTNNPNALNIFNTGSGISLNITTPNILVGTANSKNLLILTTTSATTDIGASIGLGGWTNGTSSSTVFAGIAGRKENSTAGNTRGYLQFVNGDIERARIDSNGHLGIGVTTVNSFLHLKAGTATANTAPLQFTSGPLETVPRAGVMEYNGNIYMTQGGIVRYSIGGTLFDHFADAGNTHIDNATFDDLYTDTLAANTLNTNGDKVTARYSGIFVASATATRDIKVLFAGTTILDTSTLTTATAEGWDVSVVIIRESATVVRCIATIVATTAVGAGAFQDTTYTRITGLTLSGTNILKITGVSGGTGAAANDIVAKLGTILFQPAI